MEEKKEEGIVPVDIEPIDAKRAEKERVLIREDIANYRFQISQHRVSIAQLEAAISKGEHLLADIDRRAAGADYPALPEQKPQMGQPVGGKK